MHHPSSERHLSSEVAAGMYLCVCVIGVGWSFACYGLLMPLLLGTPTGGCGGGGSVGIPSCHVWSRWWCVCS